MVREKREEDALLHVGRRKLVLLLLAAWYMRRGIKTYCWVLGRRSCAAVLLNQEKENMAVIY